MGRCNRFCCLGNKVSVKYHGSSWTCCAKLPKPIKIFNIQMHFSLTRHRIGIFIKLSRNFSYITDFRRLCRLVEVPVPNETLFLLRWKLESSTLSCVNSMNSIKCLSICEGTCKVLSAQVIISSSPCHSGKIKQENINQKNECNK